MQVETIFILLVLGGAFIAFCIFMGWLIRAIPGGPPAITNKKCNACGYWFAMVEQSGKLIREDIKFGISKGTEIAWIHCVAIGNRTASSPSSNN